MSLREKIANWISPRSAVTTSSSGADLADFFGYAQTASGQVVTPKSADSVATFYRCVALLAGAVAQLPIDHYKMDGDERESVGRSDIWWLLNESPDPMWTSSAALEWIAKCVMLRGDAFWRIRRNALGRVLGFQILHPDWVGVMQSGGRLIYTVTDPYEGTTIAVDQDDMLHFANFGFDGIRSPSIIQTAARQSLGNALAAGEFAGKSLGNDAIPRIAIEMMTKLSQTQTSDLRDSFDKIYSGSGKRYPLILGEGAKVRELSITPADMQLLETRNFDNKMICVATGVPPIMIGDGEKTTSWGTGIEQIVLGFLKFTLIPHLTRWEEEINRKIFRRAGQFVEFNTDALSRGDAKSEAEFFSKALGGPGVQGWMSVDEVRKRKNLKPTGLNTVFDPSKANNAQTNQSAASK